MHHPVPKSNSTHSSTTPPATSKSLNGMHSVSAQVQPDTGLQLTPEQTENQEFQQHQFEATKLQLQAKSGTITPEGEERLGLLQAQMNQVLQRKLDKASRFGHNLANISVHSPEAKPIQPKLTIGQPGDQYEQEADQVAAEVVSKIHAPFSHSHPAIQREEEREEPVQMRPAAFSLLQRSEMFEEEQVQMKSEAQPVAANIETSIQQAKGSGQPLSDTIRQPMEQAFQNDFSGVRVHTDAQSDQLNRSLNARAFTTGQDIFFKQGEFNGESKNGQELLAHELTHVVQQTGRLQPKPTLESTISKIEQDAAVGVEQEQTSSTIQQQPQPLAPPVQQQDKTAPEKPKKVFVIGSPSPNEIKLGHGYQFVNAARYQGVDKNTVWLVEKTGYELGGVDLGTIQSYAAGSQVQWITPNSSLVDLLNQFPDSSIQSFRVFSHGLPGQVTLRYGWEEQGKPNYGLSIPEVVNLKGNVFTKDAAIAFDSCNSGTSDFAGPKGNLAQQFAQQTGRNVEAWTGRTSYTDINNGIEDGTAEVLPSEINRAGRSIDWKEALSQYALGRVPKKKTFEPIRGNRQGGFQSYFEISTRLPSTRTFEVPEGGSVGVYCPNPQLIYPENTPDEFKGNERFTGVNEFHLVLHREKLLWDADLDTHSFPASPNSEQAVWSNLTSGTYYLEIYTHIGRNTNILIRSDIVVDVYSKQKSEGQSQAPIQRQPIEGITATSKQDVIPEEKSSLSLTPASDYTIQRFTESDDSSTEKKESIPAVHLDPGKDKKSRMLDWDATHKTIAQDEALRTVFEQKLTEQIKIFFAEEKLSTREEILQQIKQAETEGKRDRAEQLRIKLFKANEYAVVETLAVDESERYQSEKRTKMKDGKEVEYTATFCNIYAYDVVTAMGGYLPRVWWTDASLKAIRKGKEVEAFLSYDKEQEKKNTVTEMNANALTDWMKEFGKSFGWQKETDMKAAQEAANNGNLVILLAGRIDNRPGHVNVILPETEQHKAKRDDKDDVTKPLQSQAGGTNFKYEPHKNRWWEGSTYRDGAAWIFAGKPDSPLLTPEQLGARPEQLTTDSTQTPPAVTPTQTPPAVTPTQTPKAVPPTQTPTPSTQTTNPTPTHQEDLSMLPERVAAANQVLTQGMSQVIQGTKTKNDLLNEAFWAAYPQMRDKKIDDVNVPNPQNKKAYVDAYLHIQNTLYPKVYQQVKPASQEQASHRTSTSNYYVDAQGKLYTEPGGTLVGATGSQGSYITVSKKNQIGVPIAEAELGTLTLGAGGGAISIVKVKSISTEAVSGEAAQGLDGLKPIKVNPTGAAMGVLFDAGTGAFGESILKSSSQKWEPIDFEQWPATVQGKLTPEARLELNDGYVWVVMRFRLNDEAEERTRWVSSRHSKGKYQEREQAIAQQAQKLPTNLKAKADEYLKVLATVSTVEGNFGSKSGSGDTYASFGIFQWGMPKNKVGESASMGSKFFGPLKQKAVAAEAIDPSERTEEQQLYIDAWAHCTSKGLDVQGQGENTVITINGKPATGADVESTVLESMGKEDALRNYQIVAALNWVESVKNEIVRPGGTGKNSIGNNYQDLSSGQKAKFVLSGASTEYTFILPAPSDCATVGTAVPSHESLAKAVMLSVNRPNWVRTALWRAMSKGGDPKNQATESLSKLVELAEQDLASRSRKPKRKNIVAADVARWGGEAQGYYDALRQVVWPQAKAMSEAQLMAEFESQAMLLYKPSDARKFERERRFVAAELPNWSQGETQATGGEASSADTAEAAPVPDVEENPSQTSATVPTPTQQESGTSSSFLGWDAIAKIGKGVNAIFSAFKTLQELSNSVGRGAQNQASDVAAVQLRLSLLGFLAQGDFTAEIPKGEQQGNIPEKALPATVAAIERYQSDVLNFSRPDGRVDPNGKTIAALIAWKTKPTPEETQAVPSSTPTETPVPTSTEQQPKPSNSTPKTKSTDKATKAAKTANNPEAQRKLAQKIITDLRQGGITVAAYVSPQNTKGKAVKGAAEFNRQATQYAKDHRSLGISNGVIQEGIPMELNTNLSSLLQSLQIGIEELLASYPDLTGNQPMPVAVRTLAIFTHGLNNQLQAAEDAGWIKKSLGDWVDALTPFLAPDPLVLLYACSTAGQPTKGMPFAEAMRQELQESLEERYGENAEVAPEVWGHDTVGHTTGSKDLVRFDGKSDSSSDATSGDVVRAILGQRLAALAIERTGTAATLTEAKRRQLEKEAIDKMRMKVLHVADKSKTDPELVYVREIPQMDIERVWQDLSSQTTPDFSDLNLTAEATKRLVKGLEIKRGMFAKALTQIEQLAQSKTH